MAKFDIYETITGRIIAELEKGVIPWQKPFGKIYKLGVDNINAWLYNIAMPRETAKRSALNPTKGRG